MPNTRSPEPKTRGPATRDSLVRAALEEFNAHGFDGTDSNRIARRAGFAPQTFYRWFKDKAEIFIAAYELWVADELATVERLFSDKASDLALVRATVAHHRTHLNFRRSLRPLSLSDDRIRAARAESRRRQIAALARWRGSNDTDGEAPALAALLLQFERLTDALAEGEFADMGLGDAAGENAGVILVKALRQRGKAPTRRG